MNLRDLRKQAGLSVKEVASKLNIAERTLYSYESGERGLPIITADQMAKIYDVSLQDIVDAVINTRQ